MSALGLPSHGPPPPARARVRAAPCRAGCQLCCSNTYSLLVAQHAEGRSRVRCWIAENCAMPPLHFPGAGASVPGAPHPIPALEGDFSLNAANVLSAHLLLHKGGLGRLAPTHDLHAGQLAALSRGLGPRGALLEAVVHQHLPIFHTEHCVFCRQGAGLGWA